MDLHTATSPIFNESPLATIQGLGIDDGVESEGEVVLYVVKRRSDSTTPAAAGKRHGKSAVYTFNEDWVRHQPSRRTKAKGDFC